MKKHYTIVLLLVLIFTGYNKAKAQLSGELYIQNSYALWLANSKDLATFYKSYNDYQGSSLTQKMNENTGSMSGYNFGLGTRLFGSGKFYCDLALTVAKYKSGVNKAVFTTGDSRETQITSNDWGCDFGLGGGRRLSIGFLGNMGLQSTLFKAGYRYANGTLSYGPEYAFNGIYKCTRLSIFYGVAVDFRVIKYLRLGVSAGRIATMLPVDKMTFEDLSMIKGTSTMNYVPLNYGSFVNGGSFDGNEVNNNLRGWRINFNVRIQIPYGSSYED